MKRNLCLFWGSPRTLFLVLLAAVATIPALAQQDKTPPVLTGFTFSPMAVNTTTRTATVTVTMQITDDLSGVGYGGVVFISPSGNQMASANCYVLTSGTHLDGMWQCQTTLPIYSEAGVWTVYSVEVVDNVSNVQNYNTSQLQALGFPTTLEVDLTQESQTITFGALANQVLGAAPFTVSATA